VSLDPPLALVCVDLNSRSLPTLDAAERFTVNVLHADQQPWPAVRPEGR
jgi:flavin reductase (DIM6/NTAB) family NADH-FMN oxidoreductase RutF